MAVAEKAQGGAGTALSSIGSRRTLKGLPFLAVFGLLFFALGFAFGHGYWVVALWSAAAVLAWIFMRGASEVSLPADNARDE